MMEITPRTRSSTRLKRAPTPKLSERKRKLFDDQGTQLNKVPYVRLERIVIEENEDSDLGPMSPLQFSSSPSTFNHVNNLAKQTYEKDDGKGRRTDFSNIMDELTTDRNYSMRKLSLNLTKKLDDIANGGDKEEKDIIDEDVVGPLCNSMKKLNSTTDTPITSLQTDSIQQDYEQQMKTPCEMSTINKNEQNQMVRGISFRKSLIFDTSLTPHNDDSHTPPAKPSEHDSIERPKAKTSLTFNDPTISVKSFYGKPSEPTLQVKSIRETYMMSSHAFAEALTKSKIMMKKKTKSQSLAKRMEAKAPSLWRFSGKNKFLRNKHHLSKPKISKNKTTKNGMTIVEVEVDTKSENSQIFTSNIEQNLRLQKILKDQTSALNASHDIDWTGVSRVTSDKPSTSNETLIPNFTNSDDEDDENENPYTMTHSASEIPADDKNEPVEPSNRKFFKSSTSSATKKYRIMGRLSATVKRGGDLKFEPPPKRKKRKPNEDKIILHTEISSIIDRLSSPSKDRVQERTILTDKLTVPSLKINETQVTSFGRSNFIEEMKTVKEISAQNVTESTEICDVNKYRQMIPYETADPEKISQQESILELLITNGICDDKTFKIFIAEPESHKEEASKTLDSLYCVNTMIPESYENEIPSEWIDTIQTVPILIAADNDENGTTSKESTSQIAVDATLSNDTYQTSQQLFPIFNKNFNGNNEKQGIADFASLYKSSKDWIPIGEQQYQIDAGQKAFGLKQCPTCDMQYSVHEPEDELLHLKYHNSVNILSFKGWNNERVVTELDEWGLNGRIIYVCETDNKTKKERIKEILGVVDRDLGFASRQELRPKALVYLAIAKQQIVGVLVAQPLESAHRLKTENGIDFTTAEVYPAKCGISRIWVAAPYRRHKIASKLITSMRGHFRFGCFLSFDEIAFSSPTEDGKRFAASLAQRKDFLIYEH